MEQRSGHSFWQSFADRLESAWAYATLRTAKRQACAGNPEVEHRPRRILIVDDDPQVSKLYGLILAGHGYQVTAAHSGAAAATIIDAGGADLVVLDLEMPKPDGFDLLKQLRIRKPELPVLVVSGYLEGALLEASALAGAMASMSKSEAPSVMPHIVKMLLA